MTTLRLDSPAGTLTAASDGSRRVSGVIVPYGVPGATSLGRLSIRADALTLPPSGYLRLLYGHDQNRPVGAAMELTSDADALSGSFVIARTPDGDTYLAELDPAAPIRNGLSVDLVDVTIEGDQVTAGTLAAVAAVPIPAYADARATLAAQHTAEPDPPDPEPPADPPADPTPDERQTVDTDTPATATLTAAAGDGARPQDAHTPIRTAPVSALTEVSRRLTAARMQGNVGGFLSAALADITPAGNGAGNEQAGMMQQALGELWGGVGYVSKYTPLINGGALTGTTVTGFGWNPPPTVAAYSGNKAAVPSNAAKLTSIIQTPKRLAGAHDIDRIYQDLGDEAVLRSYWAKMAESLAVQLDAAGLDLIEATAGTSTALTGTPWDALVTGALEVSKYGTPTFALVASDLILAMSQTPASDAPIGGFVTLPNVTPAPELPAGTVIVGAKPAARLLTFSPPIRVEAVNIPNGGIDGGLFSYYADIIENAAAVVGYAVTAPVGTAAAASSKK